MPELPEVETVVRTLENKIKDRIIESVEIIYSRIIDNVSPEAFCHALSGQHFRKFDRRGKFLIFTLDDYVLVAHLRMEGKFFVFEEKPEIFKHTHVIFKLDKGQLHYNDTRKFGRFYLYKKNEKLSCLDILGLEPFDEKLTPQYLKQYCAKLKRPIKTTLLDQGMIAGIGNIYADEICYLSGLNPLRSCNLISLESWQKVIDVTRKVLGAAIKAGGTTIRSYTSSLGVTGLFQLSLNIHQQEKCKCCQRDVNKTRVGGRGTYYCPNCQKDKPIIVAITGTIGSGKSQALSHIKELNYKCISCDEINDELLKQKQIKENLANILKCGTEQIDKQFIANRIFNNSKDKKQVEGYLHQMILERVNKWIKENDDQKVLFVEVPLLFETGWNYYFDHNILIICDKKTSIERLIKYRGFNQEDALRRIDNQMKLEDKIKIADEIINNNSNLSNLNKLVEKSISNIVKLDLNYDSEE